MSFNPRARAGRDDNHAACRPLPAFCFNPRARAGRDCVEELADVLTRSCFNPRVRAGRDRRGRGMLSGGSQSFNPRARAGRDAWRAAGGRLRAVSIHAPARGATAPGPSCGRFGFLFQSTRPRGARRLPVLPAGDSVSCFNPRARAGRDEDIDLALGARSVVSIHAPARGATVPKSRTNGWTLCFNPRARAGRDASPRQPLCLAPGFNPRARAGRDRMIETDTQEVRVVSIHAPARGATEGSRRWLDGHVVSIHAPARGAT